MTIESGGALDEPSATSLAATELANGGLSLEQIVDVGGSATPTNGRRGSEQNGKR